MLPMMYMDDCVKSTIDFIDTSDKLLGQRVYNIGAVSFTPEKVAAEIRKHIPNFTIDYEIDPVRQSIGSFFYFYILYTILADSWPQSFEDNNARTHWGHSHTFDIEKITTTMLTVFLKFFF